MIMLLLFLVILDLVTRVLPVESFKAVFQDTDMELPCTYDIVAYTEEDYKYRFPNFKLYHAKSDRHALDLWKQYGPPSRVNRWCCSVMKTTVFRRTMKELHNTDKQRLQFMKEFVLMKAHVDLHMKELAQMLSIQIFLTADRYSDGMIQKYSYICSQEELN